MGQKAKKTRGAFVGTKRAQTHSDKRIRLNGRDLGRLSYLANILQASESAALKLALAFSYFHAPTLLWLRLEHFCHVRLKQKCGTRLDLKNPKAVLRWRQTLDLSRTDYEQFFRGKNSPSIPKDMATFLDAKEIAIIGQFLRWAREKGRSLNIEEILAFLSRVFFKKVQMMDKLVKLREELQQEITAGLARKEDLESCGPDAQRLRALIEQIRVVHPNAGGGGQLGRIAELSSSFSEAGDNIWRVLRKLDERWYFGKIAQVLMSIDRRDPRLFRPPPEGTWLREPATRDEYWI